MPASFAELTQLFRDVIGERLGIAENDAAGGPRLCFALGTPLPDDGFRLPDGSDYFPLRAQEFLSNHCNVAPRIVGDTFLPTINRIDQLFGLMLAGASPATAADAELLGAVKAEAKAEFDVVIGTTVQPGFGTFRPTHAEPDRWYDQTVADNWSSVSIRRSPPPAPTPPRGGGGGSGGGGLGSPFHQMFRPVDPEFRALLAEPISVAAVTRLQAAAKLTHGPIDSRRPFEHTHFVASEFAVDDALLDVHRRVGAGGSLRDATRPTAEAPVLAFAAGASITSEDFSLRAEVCVAQLRRPWLSSALLALDNWFVPSFERGELAAGTLEATTPVGAIPVACVLVRNLAISARWSEADRERSLASSHMGPFSLAGRRFDTTTASLLIPGMQSVAWVCQAMPVLPPRSGPS